MHRYPLLRRRSQRTTVFPQTFSFLDYTVYLIDHDKRTKIAYDCEADNFLERIIPPSLAYSKK